MIEPLTPPVETKRFYTPEEYLRLEINALEKHEYHNGEIRLLSSGGTEMAGGSYNHSLVGSNLLIALGVLLQNSPCRAVNSDMRIYTPSGSYTYPDVSVFCGAPQFADAQLKLPAETLVNPVLLAEVLSNSTAIYDRGAKFSLYRTIVSLRDYLLVDPTRIAVEHFRKADSGEWILHDYQRIEEIIPLPALGIALPLARIYAGITFESAKSV